MIDGITRPTLLLDVKKMESNIDNMLAKAKQTETLLVPHFKTHQSTEIGDLFKSKGINAITVSSIAMAEYFVDAGWKDITVAFPFNQLEIQSVNKFLDQGVSLKLLITDLESVAFLSDHLTSSLDVFIEIDAGYGRSGVPAKENELISEIALNVSNSKHLNLYGLYCHPGDTYHAESTVEIERIWSDAITKLTSLKGDLNSISNYLKIRIGDTPGCSIVKDMTGVDEIGPGNFVFFDLVMNHLNVCEEDEIAVAVACPLVAKYPERNEILIHGGAVHFSKDHLFDNSQQKFFGELVILQPDGWSSIIEGAKLTSISQEHGILKVTNELMDVLNIGDIVGILPIHSCLTANLMGSYLTLEGNKIAHM
ncbi:alanine racemase [Roseivirga sp.]|uniref:alanine racemase n=1 Tax=Roseivirga sp. TaxID=1964215 RepID=UPI003BAAECEE